MLVKGPFIIFFSLVVSFTGGKASEFTAETYHPHIFCQSDVVWCVSMVETLEGTSVTDLNTDLSHKNKQKNNGLNTSVCTSACLWVVLCPVNFPGNSAVIAQCQLTYKFTQLLFFTKTFYLTNETLSLSTVTV